MIIDKEYLKNFKTLNLKSASGGTFIVPVEEVSEINCVAVPANSFNRNKVVEGYIKITSKGGDVLGSVFGEEEAELNAAYYKMASDGLFLKNFFKDGCDVNGFVLAKANGEEVNFSVPFKPLCESIHENVIEYSNCPSAQKDGDGNLTLFLGKSSKAPTRADNDFNGLIADWQKTFGDYCPDVLKVCAFNFRGWTKDASGTLCVEFGIFNKRANTSTLPLVFFGCKNLGFNLQFPYDGRCELNASRLADGKIFVDFDGCGINFVCESIEIDWDTFYCD